jgi:hypothetical protein
LDGQRHQPNKVVSLFLQSKKKSEKIRLGGKSSEAYAFLSKPILFFQIIKILNELKNCNFKIIRQKNTPI